MRRWWLILLTVWLAVSAHAQVQDAAYPVLEKAYKSLNAQDYDGAVAGFREALAIAPERAVVHKQLGYTLLKIGETDAARDQFAEAMRLDPHDDQVALEYAFLCYETKQPVAARRTFDRLARTGNAAAKEAFENIDRPLREGIDRWQKAVQVDPGNFSAQEELARLAEQRDDLGIAADHYEKAWRLRTERRELLLDLGRIWKQMDREEDASAAVIAAWRGGTPWVSDEARELLPQHYPYLADFERALALDPTNWQLVDDIAFQKGGIPAKTLQSRPAIAAPPENAAPENAKAMGEKSLEKGYLGDALKYLQAAYESYPQDYTVMLKLGWTYNMLKDDREALHWFALARGSPDAATAEEAAKAYRNLAPEFALR